MKAVIDVLSLVGIVIFFFIGPQTSNNQTEEYILQGLPKDTLTDIVNDNGGEIVKEFKFINAIAASISQQQLDALQKEFSSLRVTKNAEINVADDSPSQSIDTMQIKFNESKGRVNWRGENVTDKPIVIDALTVRYPS